MFLLYDCYTNNDYPHRKPLPNCERKEKPVVVRLAEEFGEEAGEAVADEIKGG